eukprot:SAG31_NODE_1428_length_8391_cov_4.335866_1_plen_130_part_00
MRGAAFDDLEDDPDDDLIDLQAELQQLEKRLVSVVQSGSDALHLAGVEISEWERQKDDLYLRATSGNPSISVERPTDDETILLKNTSALDTLAASERSRLKDLKALSAKAPGNTRDPKNKKDPATKFSS